MAESHTLSGLIRKRGELKGELEYLSSQIIALKNNLEVLDKTILLFDPDYRLSSIKTIQRSKEKYFEKREFKTLILSLLKNTPNALETQEIVNYLIECKSFSFSSLKEQTSFKGSIFRNLKYYVKQDILTRIVKGHNLNYWKIKILKES